MNETTMRAKLVVETVKRHAYGEELTFRAVSKSDSYPADGSDENNTFAKFSPSATLVLNVQNPALAGKFNPGDTFYVDFTPVPK